MIWYIGMLFTAGCCIRDLEGQKITTGDQCLLVVSIIVAWPLVLGMALWGEAFKKTNAVEK